MCEGKKLFLASKVQGNIHTHFLRIVDIYSNIFQLDGIVNKRRRQRLQNSFNFNMRYSIFSVAYYPFLRGVRFNMVGSSPKIISKLSCESWKFKFQVKVMSSADSAIDRTRSIFGVKKVDCAIGRGE